MKTVAENLPDDVESLQKIIHQMAVENSRQHKKIKSQKHEIFLLQEKLNLAIQKRFAAQSEKHSPNQLGLFDEAEALVKQETEGELYAENESTEVKPHQRKKPGRKPLPESLPRIEVIHDLDEADKICPHDGHALKHIGDEISEQLEVIPAKMQVIRHIRPKYACPSCDQGLKTEPLPSQPIPKSQAAPGLLAYIAVSKYVDALPLYRQSNIFGRIGVQINRATMANWMIRSGQLVQPLINLMQDNILSYDILQMDETRVQVLNEDGRAAQSQSWMWVQRGGPPEQRLILYHYNPSRSQSVPKERLTGFSGYLQTDGYDAYNAAVIENELIHLGCMAHARRKFDEALKAQQKNKAKKAPAGKAQMGLAKIQKLYRIEKQIKDSSAEERYRVRQQQSVPILSETKKWLDKSLPQVPPSSLLGKALYYLNSQWDHLIRYCEDVHLRGQVFP